MMGFVEAIQEEGLCLTEPSLKAIGKVGPTAFEWPDLYRSIAAFGANP